MELLSLDCPRCGAHLPPQDPMGQINCGYCGAGFQAPQARAARNAAGQAVDPQQLARLIAQELAAQQRRPPLQPQYGPSPGGFVPPPSPYGHAMHHHAAQQAHHAARRAGRMVWIIVVMVLVGTFIPMAIAIFSTGAVLGDISNAATAERIRFDTSGPGPARVKIGGKPAIIARTHVVHPEDKLFVDAYDAQSVQLLWRIGPLGTHSAAYQSTHFAAIGDRLVVSHPDSTITVHDLHTGEQTSSHSTTDNAEQLCASPPGEKKKLVFVRKVDEKHLMFDVEAGELEEADEVPQWCPQDTWREGVAEPGYAPVESAPKVDGFKAEFVRIDGDLAVAGGVKHPGTAIPKLVGFNAKSPKVTWKADAYAVDRTAVKASSMEHGALAGGRFFTVYGSGTDAWHATAFDAKTGDRLWHIDLRPIFAVDSINGVYATQGQMIVVRTSSLEVFDAETGALLGTIGDETYD